MVFIYVTRMCRSHVPPPVFLQVSYDASSAALLLLPPKNRAKRPVQAVPPALRALGTSTGGAFDGIETVFMSGVEFETQLAAEGQVCN